MADLRSSSSRPRSPKPGDWESFLVDEVYSATAVHEYREFLEYQNSVPPCKIEPKTPAPAPAPAQEHVLPSPHVAADAAAVLLETGVRPEDIRRAAGMCPELMSVPVETITAALRFLTDEAGVPAEELPRVLRRRPRLLVSSAAARLRPTLYFLRALGVPDLHRRADLLSFSVEDKLLPRIEFLESLGLPSRAARSMARRFPALFYYGIDGNMRPKAEYLLGVMGRDADELFDFPEYFSYALDTRIATRHEACAARGVRMPLPAMLRPGEPKFEDCLAGCVGAATAAVAPLARLLGGWRRRRRRRGGREGKT
ncbi:hypothetical protein TRIUR3_32728 [Triticum urartu]|uniref:mTERF domain-containing protein 1, mitochondrial n=1 Tax=Triticum urartu TaxID=4572 RepID=M7YH19_TRIUA|nr:hypothetical protein TRIUR3_32728 [Triticum urartu]